MGSQFRNPGLFEVAKATKAEDKAEQSTADNRALEVSVGSDLEGTAEIRVAIVTSGEQLETATLRGEYSKSFLSFLLLDFCCCCCCCCVFHPSQSQLWSVRVIITAESTDEILWCDHSNETSSAVLSHGTINIPYLSILQNEIWDAS